MSSQKSRKSTPARKAAAGNRRKIALPLFIAAFAVIVAVGWFLFDGTGTKTGDLAEPEVRQQETSPTSASNAVRSEPVQKLVGRWQRPDGGYVLEISGGTAGGELDAAYFNPRPIHVSTASFTADGKGLHVFIELRDVGYPGATYNLDYDAARGVLAGQYYQPSVGQTFQVEFIRMP